MASRGKALAGEGQGVAGGRGTEGQGLWAREQECCGRRLKAEQFGQLCRREGEGRRGPQVCGVLDQSWG